MQYYKLFTNDEAATKSNPVPPEATWWGSPSPIITRVTSLLKHDNYLSEIHDHSPPPRQLDNPSCGECVCAGGGSNSANKCFPVTLYSARGYGMQFTPPLNCSQPLRKLSTLMTVHG